MFFKEKRRKGGTDRSPPGWCRTEGNPLWVLVCSETPHAVLPLGVCILATTFPLVCYIRFRVGVGIMDDLSAEWQLMSELDKEPWEEKAAAAKAPL